MSADPATLTNALSGAVVFLFDVFLVPAVLAVGGGIALGIASKIFGWVRNV